MTLLPDVEVLRRTLERELVGSRVEAITVHEAKRSGRAASAKQLAALAGRELTAVERRGRRLLLTLGGDVVLVIPAGTGSRLGRAAAPDELPDDATVVVAFSGGAAVHFTDPSGAGEVTVIAPAEASALSDAGFDPLTNTVPWPDLADALAAQTQPLKVALAEDSVIVGLGDVYSDEVLWTAGLSGMRSPASLSQQEVRRLHRGIQEVLFEAVKQGVADDAAEFEPPDEDEELLDTGHHHVHGREGFPCHRCRTPIELGDVEGQPWFHCPQCQA